MKKQVRFSLLLLIGVLFFSFAGCNGAKNETLNLEKKSTEKTLVEDNNKTGTKPIEPKEENPIAANLPKKELTKEELAKFKPNEDGKIMVVMFHSFVETFTPTKSNNGEYSTTFEEFRKLLGTLYDQGYRLINVNDYLNNTISVPAGTKPMMFTFDDATPGQFNLVEEDGKLVVNKQSAVGIMEEFNKTHPDFGLKGTFYVNLGLSVFEGKGTLAQRLQYLISHGFEIGNHTYTHIFLNTVKTAEIIQREIGKNNNTMQSLVPGYTMTSLALPYGNASKELQGFVAKGEYEGISYHNIAIMEVGAEPAVSPNSKRFKPVSTRRVRATGIKAVPSDLAWWLQNIPKDNEYISDGNPETVTIPKSKETDVDQTKLGSKKLIIYEP